MASNRRIRQHINPFSFRPEVTRPDWAEVFARPDQPLEVDVGSAHGEFLLDRAERAPEVNLVGLEIRSPWVELVRERAARRDLDNVHLIVCNANASFTTLFLPDELRAVYVHFPDPWFKARHHKRRVLTPEFLDQVASRLEPSGVLRFQTDHEPYADEVLDLVEAHPAFANAFGPRAPEVPDPDRVRTHREAWHESQGHTIRRYLWRKRTPEAAE